MGIAPPLGHVTGAVEPAEVFGRFGPSADIASLWQGACIGGCGLRPFAHEDSPTPTCLECMRLRHGVTRSGEDIGSWHPTIARVLPGELSPPISPPISPPKPPPQVLRQAVEVSHDDASLPPTVRGLLKLAGPAARVTAAVAVRPDGGIVASLAVRVPGTGFAVYTRGEDSAWAAGGAMLADPQLRRVGVTEFAARLAGVEYVPPAPPEPAWRGCCVQCRAEVSITKDGKIYASHKCKINGVEGRS
jgi:hypothetical protein